MLIMNTFRRIASACLLLCVLASTTFTAWNVWAFSQSWVGSFLVERSEAELEKALAKLSQKFAEPDQILEQLVREFVSEPRNWLVIDSLMEILVDEKIDLPKDIQIKYDNARNTDRSLSDQTISCAKCAWDQTACDATNLLACRLPIELTPIGDAQGVWNAGSSYVAGENFDKVDASLSAVGLGATTLTVLTVGAGSVATVPVKVGAGVLKILRRAGKLPKWMLKILKDAAGTGVNWQKFSKARSLEELNLAINKRALRPVKELSNGLGGMFMNVGPTQTVYLVEQAKKASIFRGLVASSRVYGKKTAGYMKLIGSNRLVRATLKFSDELYGLVLGILGVVTSLIVSLLTGTFGYLSRRLLLKLNSPLSKPD